MAVIVGVSAEGKPPSIETRNSKWLITVVVSVVAVQVKLTVLPGNSWANEGSPVKDLQAK